MSLSLTLLDSGRRCGDVTSFDLPPPPPPNGNRRGKVERGVNLKMAQNGTLSFQLVQVIHYCILRHHVDRLYRVDE